MKKQNVKDRFGITGAVFAAKVVYYDNADYNGDLAGKTIEFRKLGNAINRCERDIRIHGRAMAVYALLDNGWHEVAVC